jgi:rhodanese-related sulfurtransferase
MNLIFYDQNFLQHTLQDSPLFLFNYLTKSVLNKMQPLSRRQPKAVQLNPSLQPISKDILESMLEPEITTEAFAKQRQQPNPPVLLDVREPWEFQTASLPNSLLMPMGEVASRAHTELDPDAPIVVMCHHGARSLNVALWLRDQGFTHAQSLAGGIDAWSRSIDPNIPRY